MDDLDQQQDTSGETGQAALFIYHCLHYRHGRTPPVSVDVDLEQMENLVSGAKVPDDAIDIANGLLRARERAMSTLSFCTDVIGYHKIPYGLNEKYRPFFEDLFFRTDTAEPILEKYAAVIADAAGDNCEAFFHRLSKELKRKPLPDLLRIDKKPEYIFARYWTDTSLIHPPLCFFTNGTLVDLLRIVAGRKITQQAVAKIRERLELPFAPDDFLFHVMEIRVRDGVIVPVLSEDPRGAYSKPLHLA